MTSAIACGSASSDEGAAGPGNPELADTSSSELLSGRYELSSRFDLTTAAVLPDAANESIRALANLKENPASTIMDLLVAANVPIVGTVLKWLPGALKTPFQNWFNEHVVKSIYQGAPVTQQLAGITDDLASIATRFEVVSLLEIPRLDDYGNTKVTHSLGGVAFTIADKRSFFAAPPVVVDVSRANAVAANAVHIVETSPMVEDGRLELGDHYFGVPVGDFAIKALDKVAETKLGAPNFRAALGQMIRCDELAKDVASKCIGPACVGHESDVKAMCEAGLDAIVEVVDRGLLNLNFKAMHFTSGEAKMWDPLTTGGGKDGKVDRIDSGLWIAGLNIGQGEHSVVATFTGKRIGDADAAPAGTPAK
jgi:hypothetical protein